LQEEALIEYNGEPPAQEVDLTRRIRITPLLYFLNPAQTRLVAETQDIAVPQGERKEMYVVQALIDGPVSEDLVPVAGGFVLEDIQLMPDVANVYLTLDDRKTEDEIWNAQMAITATLSDFSGRKNINVIINGVQTAYMNTPTGVLQKLDNDLWEERLMLQGRSESENPDMQAVLYFLDSSEQYLLPETRRLVFRGRDYISILVEQLISGPERESFNHNKVLDSSLELLGWEPVEGEDGTVIRLHFNKDPVAFTEQFQDGRRLALAALAFTIVGFYPEAVGIEIVVGAMQAGDGVYRPDMYGDLIGSGILLYLPYSNTSPLLTGVQRIVRQDTAHRPQTVLQELMQGPGIMDTGVYPSIPYGITYEDVNDVYVASDTLVIDFDGSITEKMNTVSDDNEFLMIYSIVNTMTSLEGIRQVQFLLDGERAGSLGGGQISVTDPLIRNPGIIRS
jgi:spore germination protein GerM